MRPSTALGMSGLSDIAFADARSISRAMTTFILVVHTLIAIALVGVILIQRSEGGGLGIGAGPAGLMTARGAANLLTRATTILAALFIGTSVLLAFMEARSKGSQPIDTTLAKPAPVETQPAGAPPLGIGQPAPGPLPGAPGATPDAPGAAQPAPADTVPLAK